MTENPKRGVIPTESEELFDLIEKLKNSLTPKLKESFASIMPITIIILYLGLFFAPVPNGTLVMFLIGALLLVIGMGCFSIGTEMAMIPMGDGIGAQITRTKKLWLIIILIFIMGVLITVAEPDLQVLAGQVSSIEKNVLIGAVAVGVGIFLVIAMLRIIFQISISKLLVAFYAIVFTLSIFAPDEFVTVAFDSGGVTTGPITVPFIMALGLGLASVRTDKGSREDSFGLVALCSVGPILAVLLLGIGYNVNNSTYSPIELADVKDTREAVHMFAEGFPVYAKEVLIAFVPIIFLFLAFQLVTKRFKKRQLERIGVGFLYTFVGLVLFLTGVNIGFIPMGYLIGYEFTASVFKWLIIPIGALIGYFIVAAEPAVHVLAKQVEQVSGGAIPSKAIFRSLSIGLAISVGLSTLRALLGISLYWFLVPGYIFALILTFRVSKIFTGIAFDSGGVATGAMTTTFLLPFIIGVCVAAGGEEKVMTDAFGTVAMIAMTPLITIQALGVIYGRRVRTVVAEEENELISASQDIIIISEEENDDIIDYDRR